MKKVNLNMDVRRKRLAYRANYRGFKEVDILLGGFAKAHIASLSEAELTMFETLLEAKDHDIYEWICGRMPVPKEYDTPVFEKICQFKPNLHGAEPLTSNSDI